MSRSNPQENVLPNPAESIFEWNGGSGQMKCFNKAEKKTTTLTDKFQFMLLEELGCVRGFDERLNCGIYSNEIKDSRADVLVVKRDKQETVAEGIYAAIRTKVNASGESFHAALYIAYKTGDRLAIGLLRFKGAALNAWIEFHKKHRADIYKKAVVIEGVVEGKKGAVNFKVPKFALKDTSETTEHDAVALDKDLQTYLQSYFAQTKRTQVERVTEHVRDEDMPSSPPLTSMPVTDDIEADDIPF